MKVLQLISSGGLYGAENVLMQLCRALPALGCDPVVGAFRNSHRPNTDVADAARREGFKVELIDCRGRFDYRATRTLREFIAREGIDVLHTHGYKAGFYGYWAARKQRVPIVATCHNWPATTTALRAYRLMDALLLRKFDHIGAVSDPVANLLYAYRIPRHKVSQIDNGIDVQHFSSGKPVLKVQYSLSGRTLVGMAGRLSPEKGFQLLLRAAKGVLATFPEAMFVLAGDGPDRTSLERLAQTLGIAENVLFVGQFSDMNNFYASLDIFVLPSLNEGLPLAVLEAMAAGKPVIASRVGAIPTVVVPGQAGILVEPGSIEQLESAIITLLQNPALREEWGRNAHQRVQERFSSMQMARKYLNIYRQVSRKHAAPVLRSTAEN